MGRAHVNSRKEDEIYGLNLSETQSELEHPHGVVAACGHNGDGKTRWIVHVVYAKDEKEAAYKARFLPRVKGDQELAIMACKKLCDRNDPIGVMKAWMINAINDHDPYLYSTHNGYHGERKAMQSNLVLKKSIDAYYKHNKSPKYKEKLDDMKTIEDIHPDDIIEQFCAPDIINGVPVMKKRINFDVLLEEWFTASVKKYAMRKFRNKKLYDEVNIIPESERTPEQQMIVNNYKQEKHARANMLMMYYKMFGKDNKLGISATQIEVVDEKTNQSKIAIQISYMGDEGMPIKFIAPDKLAHDLHFFEVTEPIFGKVKPLVDDTPRTPEEVAQSKMDRIAKFYAKYGNHIGKQPGEE